MRFSVRIKDKAQLHRIVASQKSAKGNRDHLEPDHTQGRFLKSETGGRQKTATIDAPPRLPDEQGHLQ